MKKSIIHLSNNEKNEVNKSSSNDTAADAELATLKSELAELKKQLQNLKYTQQTQRELDELKKILSTEIQSTSIKREETLKMMEAAVDAAHDVNMDQNESKILKERIGEEIEEANKRMEKELITAKQTLDEIKNFENTNDIESWLTIRKKMELLKANVQVKQQQDIIMSEFKKLIQPQVDNINRIKKKKNNQNYNDTTKSLQNEQVEPVRKIIIYKESQTKQQEINERKATATTTSNTNETMMITQNNSIGNNTESLQQHNKMIVMLKDIKEKNEKQDKIDIMTKKYGNLMKSIVHRFHSNINSNNNKSVGTRNLITENEIVPSSMQNSTSTNNMETIQSNSDVKFVSLCNNEMGSVDLKDNNIEKEAQTKQVLTEKFPKDTGKNEINLMKKSVSCQDQNIIGTTMLCTIPKQASTMNGTFQNDGDNVDLKSLQKTATLEIVEERKDVSNNEQKVLLSEKIIGNSIYKDMTKKRRDLKKSVTFNDFSNMEYKPRRSKEEESMLFSSRNKSDANNIVKIENDNNKAKIELIRNDFEAWRNAMKADDNNEKETQQQQIVTRQKDCNTDQKKNVVRNERRLMKFYKHRIHSNIKTKADYQEDTVATKPSIISPSSMVNQSTTSTNVIEMKNNDITKLKSLANETEVKMHDVDDKKENKVELIQEADKMHSTGVASRKEHFMKCHKNRIKSNIKRMSENEHMSTSNSSSKDPMTTDFVEIQNNRNTTLESTGNQIETEIMDVEDMSKQETQTKQEDDNIQRGMRRKTIPIIKIQECQVTSTIKSKTEKGQDTSSLSNQNTSNGPSVAPIQITTSTNTIENLEISIAKLESRASEIESEIMNLEEKSEREAKTKQKTDKIQKAKKMGRLIMKFPKHRFNIKRKFEKSQNPLPSTNRNITIGPSTTSNQSTKTYVNAQNNSIVNFESSLGNEVLIDIDSKSEKESQMTEETNKIRNIAVKKKVNPIKYIISGRTYTNNKHNPGKTMIGCNSMPTKNRASTATKTTTSVNLIKFQTLDDINFQTLQNDLEIVRIMNLKKDTNNNIIEPSSKTKHEVMINNNDKSIMQKGVVIKKKKNNKTFRMKSFIRRISSNIIKCNNKPCYHYENIGFEGGNYDDVNNNNNNSAEYYDLLISLDNDDDNVSSTIASNLSAEDNYNRQVVEMMLVENNNDDIENSTMGRRFYKI